MEIGLEDYASAEAHLQRAIGIAESIGVKFPKAYSFLTEACLGQGEIEDALAAARRAVSLAQASQEDVGGAWRALGMVAAQLSEPVVIDERAVDAPDCFAESLRVFTEMGAEGERARTLRAWARYEIAHGDQQTGSALWQEAREIFERLGMRLEVERGV
jgi:tetratricopeptide (TPR) repeat protein